jgi:hypothetical protein
MGIYMAFSSLESKSGDLSGKPKEIQTGKEGSRGAVSCSGDREISC